MSVKSDISVMSSPRNAPPDIIQKAHRERLAVSWCLPLALGKTFRAVPSDKGIITSHIAIKSRDCDIPLSSLTPPRASVWTNNDPIAIGISIQAPRFSSAIPGESGFSTKASEPLIVTSMLALNAIIGIAERAIRNEPEMTSLDDGSSALFVRENKSTTMEGSVDPIGLIVMTAPKRVNATRDFDHSGFPEPTETE